MPASSGSRRAKRARSTRSSGCCWRRRGRRSRTPGSAGDRLAGTATGVFVGPGPTTRGPAVRRPPTGSTSTCTTGTGRYAASGRLSYLLDCPGPSLTRRYRLLVVAGRRPPRRARACAPASATWRWPAGANVILEPHITIAYSQIGDDGARRPLQVRRRVRRRLRAQRRRGAGRAEAPGRRRRRRRPHLRRHPRQRRHQRRPQQRLHGAPGLGRPGGHAPPGLRRRRRRSASASRYVEAHGTGTAAGDPSRAAGPRRGASVPVDRPDGAVPGRLGQVEHRPHRGRRRRRRVWSRLALALQHGEIPASLHVRRAEPGHRLGSELGARRGPRRTTPWPAADGPRRGGVSAFGISGTNAHVVLEAGAGRGAGADRGLSPVGPVRAGPVGPRDAALRATGRSLRRPARSTGRGPVHGGAWAQWPTARRSGALRGGRPRRRCRPHRAARRSRTASPIRPATLGRSDPPRVVFVFPGQGSQWAGMARELLADEPGVRRRHGRGVGCHRARGGMVAARAADRPGTAPSASTTSTWCSRCCSPSRWR